MGSISQPKNDRLGHSTSSLSIYLCNLRCGSRVSTYSPNVALDDLNSTPKNLGQSAAKYLQGSKYNLNQVSPPKNQKPLNLTIPSKKNLFIQNDINIILLCLDQGQRGRSFNKIIKRRVRWHLKGIIWNRMLFLVRN